MGSLPSRHVAHKDQPNVTRLRLRRDVLGDEETIQEKLSRMRQELMSREGGGDVSFGVEMSKRFFSREK